MRWRGGRRSQNIEDRRGTAGPSRRGMRISGRSGGIGIIVLALVAIYFGVDPSIILNQGAFTDSGPAQEPAPRPSGQGGRDDELAQFVSVVLADTEDTWTELFRESGRTYREPTLVLFSGSVRSACGFAEAAMGPFYCPSDEKVYIDLSFYRELRDRFHAPGDFAQAYVIAHEIGHHVQNLLGISDQVERARRGAGKTEANRISVMLELQADCLSGIWAYHADRSRQILEQGDLEEALNAASQIGDDRMQKRARGYINPDSFTHGSSAQRVRWFRQGMKHGRIGECNTFESDSL